jgi:hypothetical protein
LGKNGYVFVFTNHSQAVQQASRGYMDASVWWQNYELQTKM